MGPFLELGPFLEQRGFPQGSKELYRNLAHLFCIEMHEGKVQLMDGVPLPLLSAVRFPVKNK